MSTLRITFEEYKKIAEEVFESIPTANMKELKKLRGYIGYAYLMTNDPYWETSALCILRMCFEDIAAREESLMQDQAGAVDEISGQRG